MAMEVRSKLVSASVSSSSSSSSVKDFEEDLGEPHEHLLEDFDSYMEDINDRLTVSRMVNDSVIKGMVTAVQQDATSIISINQQEHAFQHQIQDMVLKYCFQDHLWHLNAHFSGTQNVQWAQRMDEISKLRQELNSIYTSLSMPETDQLISHGSLDFEERNYSKKTAPHEENGKHAESPGSQHFISHSNMTKDELINCLKSELAQMKRDHESDMHKKTEQYYTLKREYLKSEYFKEKGHFFSLKRDKESDRLRKKIPDVILKLDDILVNTEKLSASSNTDNLKDRLIHLLSENRQLRDFLEDKENEVKSLSSNVSDAADKMLNHSFTEAKLLKMISKLKGDIEDFQIEALITVEVSKCVLEEWISLIKLNSKELHMLTQCSAKTASKCEIQDSDIESIVMEGLLGIVCREACKDAEAKLNKLYEMYTSEKNSLQMEFMDSEKRFTLEAAEKERFKQEVHLLKANIEEKEKFTLEAMAKEKERFELVNQENNRLRDYRFQQQSILSKSHSELDAMKFELDEAVKQINKFKVETNDLNQKLEYARNDLMDANEERRALLAATQDRQSTLLVTEAQEKHKDTIVLCVHKFIKEVADFECRVAEDVKSKRLRVETANHRIQKLRITSLQFKRKLEKRCVDLRKAETEVDLLGDEVDTLLSLMEKIYIALDHYSPILQHYPGIMEILKLVRRELSGEFLKLN